MSSRACWDEQSTLQFIAVCKELLLNGLYNGKCLNNNYGLISQKLVERTGIQFSNKQLKSKRDTLRRHWLAFRGLMSETSVGWKPLENTAAGNDEWWADYLKKNKYAAPWRHRGPTPEMLSDMELLFAGNTATGDHAVPSTAYNSDNQEEGSGRSGDVNFGNASAGSDKKRSRGLNQKKGRTRRRKTSMSEMICTSCTSLKNIATHMEVKQSRVSRLASAVISRDPYCYSPSSFVHMLNNIPDLPPEVYDYAINFLSPDPVMREVYISLPSNEVRLRNLWSRYTDWKQQGSCISIP